LEPVSTEMSKRSTQLDWQPISDCFDQLRNEREALSEFLVESFSELDDLRSQLEEHWRHLSQGQTALAKQQGEFDARRQQVRQNLESQSDNRAAQITALEVELETARREMSQLLDTCIEERSENETQIEQLEQQRDRYAEELAAAKQRLAQFVKSWEVLARSRGASSEFNDADAVAPEALEDSYTATEESIEEIALHKQQVAELQEERDALEKELDSVRLRANELNNTVDVTRRQMAEQQAQWSVELKQMRQVLQRQAELISAGQTVSPATAPAAVAVPAPTVSDEQRANERVVGAVMAQFEKLRQQRAQRCANRATDVRVRDTSPVEEHAEATN